MKTKFKIVDKDEQLTKIDTFIVNISMTDGSVETYENVMQFGPVQGSNLLSIMLSDGSAVVYNLNDNFKKYSFKKNV